MERVNLKSSNGANTLLSVTEESEGDVDSGGDLGPHGQKWHQERNDGGNNKTETGLKKAENIFDGICDGVISSMALAHEAMQDLLEFKDEMLKHALPSTVLLKLALVTGRVFRSISDLGMPVEELVRLVRVYSPSWEETRADLRKLHEHLESKQDQLNIAVRRLQLLDEQTKQVARERRIMNWEKLFSKVTETKSHGRRWKFHIKAIKQKGKLGLEHVQTYTQGLDDYSLTEKEEVYSENSDGISEKHDSLRARESETENKLKGLDSVTSEDTEDSKDDENDEKVPLIVVHTELLSGTAGQPAPKRVQFDQPIIGSLLSKSPMRDVVSVPSKPPMRDAQSWTQEPEFDRVLFVRIFSPEGLKQSELKCSLSYNGNMFKTPILESQNDENFDDNIPGIMTSRPIERPLAARKILDKSQGISNLKPGSSSGRKKRFYEFQIKLPDEIKDGVSLLNEKPLPEPQELRFAVHMGKFEEIIAVTSIAFHDIKKMSLETISLPPPHGDNDAPGRSSRPGSFSNNSSFDGDSLGDSLDIPIIMDDHFDHLTSSSPHEDLIKNKESHNFSLYSLQSGKSDAVRAPCGNLPVLMYWGKCVRPLYFNRQCGTRGISDLVFDMTGIDLTTASQEKLHKEMVDEALSVVSFTPRIEQDMVSRSELDKMVEQHQQEMVDLQEVYEKRLQELTDNLQVTQSDYTKSLPLENHRSRPVSTTSEFNRTGTLSPGIRLSKSLDPVLMENGENVFPKETSLPLNLDRTLTNSVRTPVLSASLSTKQRPLPPRTHKPSKNYRVGQRLPRWGENLPQDFFERLRLWEEESKQHKQELNERTLKEIKDNLERKLAGQHKLSKHEEQMYDALKDVSLPALFMPYKTGHVYNPRAHNYFQPTGATNVRLTQPPSVFQLPPLPDTKLSVVNLFELSKNFHIQGPTWLLERYTENLQAADEDFQTTPVLPQVNIPESASFNENINSRTSPSGKKEVEL